MDKRRPFTGGGGARLGAESRAHKSNVLMVCKLSRRF